MKTIAVLNAKGGVGKTAISHLLSRVFGEVGYSVFLLHTDARNEDMPQSVRNRPYLAWALRPHLDPDGAITDYEKLREAIANLANCIMIIDGGANRRNVDTMVAESADLIIIPVGTSNGDIVEALETHQRVAKHRAAAGMAAIPVRYVLSDWPGERRKLEVLGRASHVADFYTKTRGKRFETIVTSMPSIVSLMDQQNPTINTTLRRVGRELANEICGELNLPKLEDMLARTTTELEDSDKASAKEDAA